MKSQPELEERLRAAPEWLEVGPPPIRRIVRRGRRRLATKVLSSTVVAIVVGVALVLTGTSLSGFRQDLRLGDGTTIPKPRIVATIRLSGIPWGVAFEGRKVWVASYFDDLILGVDPDRNLEVDRISVPIKTPYEVVAGGGAVWATAFKSILRVDPAGHRARDVSDLVGPSTTYPTGMASGDGSIWIADWHQDHVVRFDPATNRVLARISLENPTEIAFGDGSLWVGSCQDKPSGRAGLYRIDARTNSVADTVSLPTTGCAGLPAVGGGYVYAVTTPAEKDPNAQLWKIDPRTGQVTARPLSINAPGTMVVYRGVVWTLSRDSRGSDDRFLTLIDAAAMRVLTRMSVGQNAWRIAVGDGSLWIPAMEEGRRPVLLRIAP